VILSSPSLQTYVTTPGSALPFPSLCVPTGNLAGLETESPIEYCGDRNAMMPRRCRTRRQDRADRVAAERRRNHVCPHDPSSRLVQLPRPGATDRRRRATTVLTTAVAVGAADTDWDKESVICGNSSLAVLISVHARIDARCRPGPCCRQHGARWRDAKRWCGERRRPGPRTKSIGRCLSGRPELDRGRSGGDQPLQRFGLPALESQWPATRERGLPRKMPDTAGQEFSFAPRNVQGCDGPTLEFPARRPGQE
jgi:hypothetical protein